MSAHVSATDGRAGEEGEGGRGWEEGEGGEGMGGRLHAVTERPLILFGIIAGREGNTRVGGGWGRREEGVEGMVETSPARRSLHDITASRVCTRCEPRLCGREGEKEKGREEE